MRAFPIFVQPIALCFSVGTAVACAHGVCYGVCLQGRVGTMSILAQLTVLGFSVGSQGACVYSESWVGGWGGGEGGRCVCYLGCQQGGLGPCPSLRNSPRCASRCVITRVRSPCARQTGGAKAACVEAISITVFVQLIVRCFLVMRACERNWVARARPARASGWGQGRVRRQFHLRAARGAVLLGGL